jgi:hypothetical protein
VSADEEMWIFARGKSLVELFGVMWLAQSLAQAPVWSSGSTDISAASFLRASGRLKWNCRRSCIVDRPPSHMRCTLRRVLYTDRTALRHSCTALLRSPARQQILLPRLQQQQRLSPRPVSSHVQPPRRSSSTSRIITPARRLSFRMSAVTRSKYFSNALLRTLPIVGVQEGDQVVLVKPEAIPAAAAGGIAAAEAAAASSSSSSTATGADGLSQLDLRSFRVSSSFLCTTCRIAFELSDELRSHSKTPWHNHNVKAKTRQTGEGAGEILSEEKFIQRQHEEKKSASAASSSTDGSKSAAAAEEDSASSGASSADESEARDAFIEDDDDQRNGVGSSRVIFYTPTQKLSVWKQALVSPVNPPAHLPLHLKSFAYVSALRVLPQAEQMAVIMCSGGRFSGAVFKRDTLVVSKNFQRYTTRRKQGGAQSAHDAAKGKANSIGSSIRRKETIRYQEETERIVTEWKDLLAACQLVFLFAPGANRLILHKAGLLKSDERIRNVPFPTYRPTLDEVKRIHQSLTTVEFEDRVNVPFDLENQAAVSPPPVSKHQQEKAAAAAAASTSSSKPSPSPPVDALSLLPEPVTDDLLVNAVRSGDIDLVRTLLSEECDYERPFSPGHKRFRPLVYEAVATTHATTEAKDTLLQWLLSQPETDVNEQTLDAEDEKHIICWSPLHKACASNYEYGILALLRHGADPTIRDSRSRLPLPLISSAGVRLSVRRLAGSAEFRTQWPWEEQADLVRLTAEAEEAAEAAKRAKAKEKKQKAKERQKKEKAAEQEEAARADEQRELEIAQAQQQQALRESAAVVQEAMSARAQAVGQLSDREKRALAAERRLGAASGSGVQCALCKNAITKTPFERLTYKYCDLRCLTAHRLELEAKAGGGGSSSSSSATKSASYNPK